MQGIQDDSRPDIPLIPGAFKNISILCYDIDASHPGALLLVRTILYRNTVAGHHGMITKSELILPSIRPFPTLVDMSGLGSRRAHPYQYELFKRSCQEGEHAMIMALVLGRGVAGELVWGETNQDYRQLLDIAVSLTHPYGY